MKARFFRTSLMALFLMVLTAFGSQVHAGISAWSGDAGEKLWVQDAPKLGANAAILKIEGVQSTWAGKFIRVEKSKTSTGDRYSFDHGRKNEKYFALVEMSPTAVQGTSTRRMELYLPKQKDPLVLKHDVALTKESQSTDLVSEFAKTPYTPEM